MILLNYIDGHTQKLYQLEGLSEEDEIQLNNLHGVSNLYNYFEEWTWLIKFLENHEPFYDSSLAKGIKKQDFKACKIVCIQS